MDLRPQGVFSLGFCEGGERLELDEGAVEVAREVQIVEGAILNMGHRVPNDRLVFRKGGEGGLQVVDVVIPKKSKDERWRGGHQRVRKGRRNQGSIPHAYGVMSGTKPAGLTAM